MPYLLQCSGLWTLKGDATSPRTQPPNCRSCYFNYCCGCFNSVLYQSLNLCTSAHRDKISIVHSTSSHEKQNKNKWANGKRQYQSTDKLLWWQWTLWAREVTIKQCPQQMLWISAHAKPSWDCDIYHISQNSSSPNFSNHWLWLSEELAKLVRGLSVHGKFRQPASSGGYASSVVETGMVIPITNTPRSICLCAWRKVQEIESLGHCDLAPATNMMEGNPISLWCILTWRWFLWLFFWHFPRNNIIIHLYFGLKSWASLQQQHTLSIAWLISFYAPMSRVCQGLISFRPWSISCLHSAVSMQLATRFSPLLDYV